jgi:hypothetical protein
MKRERKSLLDELPDGTEITIGDPSITVDKFDLDSDDEKRAWIIKIMKAFANVLRPRLRKWYDEIHS